MKKILHIVFVAMLATIGTTAWGQTNRTLGNIPDGWTVTANGQNVNVNNGTATITDGAEVLLFPPNPALVKSVTLTDAPTPTTSCRRIPLDTLQHDFVAQDCDTLTGTLGANVKISIADGATVVLNNATISYSGNGADYAGLTLLGDGTIQLADGTTNTVVGGLDGDGYSNWPGIYVPEGKTLTINGNTGVLNAARGGDDTEDGSPAGIGAGWSNSCGNIVINGGIINATGGGRAAGIGSCGRRGCGDITINGGTVIATGGVYGPGIGLGGTNQSNYTDCGTCGNITINGGTVTATGGEYGAGIGTGRADGKSNVTATKTCGNILISGGTVTATGGKGAVGIGTGVTGDYSSITCGTITITDGVTLVTANRGINSTAETNSIGRSSPSNSNNTCGTVTIGGTVYYQNNAYVGDGATYLTQSTIVYPAPTPTETTVMWNSSFISGIDIIPWAHDEGASVSQGNITATFTVNAGWWSSGIVIGNSSAYGITFSSTSGNISKIEIYGTDNSECAIPSGWTYESSKLTWQGTPAQSVTLNGVDGEPGADIHIDNISQIVFTVQQ